ncbi:helix-turn-helix transcriptional regulator [Ureibacillus sp. MALMAid1270]|uniref:helix-turn-helix transcriptional regulator n=1 Tax=Ureibacillus sp. MALMAid1270 TaxID=3411629 RepID=UPI003BA83587
MDRDVLIQLTSENVKLVRLENNYSIDKMAEMIGITRKHLLKIEKGKAIANWPITIAICTLFRDSRTLKRVLGGDPLDLIDMSTKYMPIFPQDKTFGGNVLWKNIEEFHGFRLQQNIVTRHFRIIDNENYRLISTSEEDFAMEKWKDLSKTVDLVYSKLNVLI